MRCLLCESGRTEALRSAKDPNVYFACSSCDFVFLDPAQRLTGPAERARYDLHRCEPGDEGYARFTAPLIERLMREARPPARGLDFGAGRVPALAGALERLGFQVSLYDLFYWPDVGALRTTYEFVVSCEVIEHLFEPRREFARLRELLAPGAPLILMTQPWTGRGAFHDWPYRRDPTHVSFFAPRTFRWIAEHYGFRTCDVDGRVICLSTREGTST